MTHLAETPPPPRWKILLRWGERLLLLGLLGFAAWRLGPQLGALTGIGRGLGPAPGFTIVSLEGDTIRSADLRGQVIVLNFWATWCLPCRIEMPSLEKLHEELGGRGVTVLGLATDSDPGAPISAFLSQRGISYPVGRASLEHRRDFDGIAAIPTTFIIDADGLIRHRVVGYFAPPALRAAVERYVEPPT